MSNNQERYKSQPSATNTTDINARRLVRTAKLEERRKEKRAHNYAKHRVIPAESHENEGCSPSTTDVAVKLRRWQIERNMKRKKEMEKKKPVFKVGVVHHKFYSPPVTNKPEAPPPPCHSRGGHKVKHQPTPTKRITRATQKRLDAKLAGTSTTPAARSIKRPNRTKTVRKRLPSMTKEAGTSFAPDNYSFKPPEGLAEVPLFGRYAIPRPSSRGNKSHGKKEPPLPDAKNDETPWPHASNPPVDIMSTRNSRNLLVRQEAVERHSLELPEAPSRLNSSIDAFTLRLSSEDDSAEETNVEAKPINVPNPIDDPKAAESEENVENEIAAEVDELGDAEVAEEIDEPDAEELAVIAEIIATETTTPPRSGTPVPASFSPYIVTSRGKGSARKEQKMKMGIGCSPADDVPTKDTVMQNLNISAEEEEKTAQYFKFIMQREIERLTEMCNKWDAIMNEPDLTEDAQYQINQAIGQTKLLMRKKFERFRSLVSDCETGKGEMLVQCRDLQGFWDMVYMEVKDCESRFLRLDQLKSKDWIEEQIYVTNKKVSKKKVASSKAKPSAKSSARSWILAARKKKMSQTENVDTDDIVIAVKGGNSEPSNVTTSLIPKEQNSRRSLRTSPSTPAPGRTVGQSPPRSATKKTPTSLLKQVQLSQASKNIRSPLAVMKVSKLWKTPEVKLDDTISYVNSDQTPAKGILKKSDDSSVSDSCPPKSTRKVDFNDDVFLEDVSVENELDDELQNSIDLGRALARIDTYDEDESEGPTCDPMQNVTVRRAEKRLDFEDDSFEETENTDTAESAAVVAAIPSPPTIPTYFVTSESPITSVPDVTPSPSRGGRKSDRTPSKSSRRISRRSEKLNETPVEMEQPMDSSIRVLRNRTVPAEAGTKKNRRSVKSSAIVKHNISLNSSTKENSDPLREFSTESTPLALDNVTEVPVTVDLDKRRRSTRKSVKFNSDDCTICTPKPALPATPRTRRSNKRVSLLGDSSRESLVPPTNGDLMSFDSPMTSKYHYLHGSKIVHPH